MASDQKAKATKAADEAEVKRVLAAKSDHEVLQLRAGQADRASVKKRYRAMTLALHPDKCKVGNRPCAALWSKRCNPKNEEAPCMELSGVFWGPG